MTTIYGHFDGKAIVLDQPASLAVGQRVRVVVEPPAASPSNASPNSTSAEPLFGAWKGKLRILKDDDEVILDHFKIGDDFDERDALNIDPCDAVPPDFVRQPGSAAGQIKMSDDFDETPDEFKEYL